MQPIQPDQVILYLKEFEERHAYIHFEFPRGGFLRNLSAKVKAISLRGEGPYRVGIQCEQDGWVVMEELTHMETSGPGLFLCALEDDQRLSRALQLSLEPFAP